MRRSLMLHPHGGLRSGQFANPIRTSSLLLFLLAVASCQKSDSPWRPVKVPIAEALGIQVQTPNSPFTTDGGPTEIQGDVPSDEGVQRFCAILDCELKLYPPELLNKAGFQRLVLCKDLTRPGRKNPPAGSAAPHRGTIYVNVDAMLLSHHWPEILHHEIYHLIDYADGGLDLKDESWECLTASHDTVMSGISPAADRMMGLVSLYSGTSTAEDKAEMFSRLVADPLFVEYIAERDPIVGNKTEQLVQSLREFCEECDDDFWSRVRQQRLDNEDYKQYADVLQHPVSVYLVHPAKTLEAAAFMPPAQSSAVKKLTACLNGADMNLLHMYSHHSSRAPFYELRTPSGDLATGPFFIKVSGLQITNSQIARDFMLEVTEIEKIELPLFMDLMYGSEKLGVPSAWYVSIRPASKVAANSDARHASRMRYDARHHPRAVSLTARPATGGLLPSRGRNR